MMNSHIHPNPPTVLDSMVKIRRADYLDLAGALTSGLCAFHCALLPALTGLLPVVGIGILADERTETAFLAASSVLATISVGLGYRKHRSRSVVAVATSGLISLGFGHFAETRGYEGPSVILVVAGSLAIAGAHLLNLRCCRSGSECCVVRPESNGPLANRDWGKNAAEAMDPCLISEESGQASAQA